MTDDIPTVIAAGFDEGPRAPQLVLHGDALQVAERIRARILGSRLTAAQRKSALEAATYPTNKAPHLNYPTALAKGWPIATGAIEGACRHLVKDDGDARCPNRQRTRSSPTAWSTPDAAPLTATAASTPGADSEK